MIATLAQLPLVRLAIDAAVIGFGFELGRSAWRFVVFVAHKAVSR